MASLSAVAGIPNHAVYAATKAFVFSLTEGLRSDLAADHIRVADVSVVCVIFVFVFFVFFLLVSVAMFFDQTSNGVRTIKHSHLRLVHLWLLFSVAGLCGYAHGALAGCFQYVGRTAGISGSSLSFHLVFVTITIEYHYHYHCYYLCYLLTMGRFLLLYAIAVVQRAKVHPRLVAKRVWDCAQQCGFHREHFFVKEAGITMAVLHILRGLGHFLGFNFVSRLAQQ